MRLKTAAMILGACMLLAVGYMANAGERTAPQSTPALRQALTSGKKTIIFFLNPMGGPCRHQNDILSKLQQDRGRKFAIAYVDANKPEDQKAFYDYGVRGLPSLVLVDSKGKIGKVFPPGIQSYEALASALDSVK